MTMSVRCSSVNVISQRLIITSGMFYRCDPYNHLFMLFYRPHHLDPSLRNVLIGIMRSLFHSLVLTAVVCRQLSSQEVDIIMTTLTEQTFSCSLQICNYMTIVLFTHKCPGETGSL